MGDGLRAGRGGFANQKLDELESSSSMSHADERGERLSLPTALPWRPSQLASDPWSCLVSHPEKARMLLSALLLVTNWGRLRNTCMGIFTASSLPAQRTQIISYEIKGSCPGPEKQADGRRAGEGASSQAPH